MEHDGLNKMACRFIVCEFGSLKIIVEFCLCSDKHKPINSEELELYISLFSDLSKFIVVTKTLKHHEMFLSFLLK